jgi:hypothetical protein
MVCITHWSVGNKSILRHAGFDRATLDHSAAWLWNIHVAGAMCLVLFRLKAEGVHLIPSCFDTSNYFRDTRDRLLPVNTKALGSRRYNITNVYLKFYLGLKNSLFLMHWVKKKPHGLFVTLPKMDSCSPFKGISKVQI